MMDTTEQVNEPEVNEVEVSEPEVSSDDATSTDSDSSYDDAACINDAVKMCVIKQDMEDATSTALTMMFVCFVGVYVFASTGVALVQPQGSWSTTHTCPSVSNDVEDLYSRYEVWLVLVGVVLAMQNIAIVVMARAISRWSVMQSDVQWYILGKVVGEVTVS